MNYSQMVSQLAKPGSEILESLTPLNAHLIHMSMGICGEVAELIEANVLKYIIEELGDVEFYFEGMCQGLDIELPSTVLTLDEISKTDCGINFKEDVVVKAGSILDTTKKLTIYGNKNKLHELLSHMKDFRNMLDLFYGISNISRSHVLAANMKKLGKRYQGFEYSDSSAIARVDKSKEISNG